MEETLDQISPILPADFFTVELTIPYVQQPMKPLKNHALLPNFSDLLQEKHYAKVFMSWHEDGLVFDVHVDDLFNQAAFPHFRKGDSIELFIDTRNLKSAGFLTKFCHHFVILPIPVDGIHAQEMTIFRTDDRHDLCDPKKIFIKREEEKRSSRLKIFLPKECLYGYDPVRFHRLGFAYQINRCNGDLQHFILSSEYMAIEKENALWVSVGMKKR